MGELAEATGLPVDEITRLLYALSILGVAVPADALPKGAVAPAIPVSATGTASLPRSVIAEIQAPPPAPPVHSPSAPATAPQTPPAPSLSAADVERKRNEIMQAYLTYRRQDAFDLLGAPETATLPAIEAKFLELARRFAPWSLDHPELRSMEDRGRELFLAGARAFAELADTEQRNTLLFRRKTLREEREKKTAGFGGIKTDLLDSEAQFKKGLALMEAGKNREAIQYLEFASDCDPQNGIYRAELAWSRFLLSSGHANQALKELQEALRLDANCGLAAFYAGEIHRQLGNRDDAENYLRRAIKLMSPDRRPIDALKLLPPERKR
jgi:tetratricopeptide (TPR) repeat protein